MPEAFIFVVIGVIAFAILAMVLAHQARKKRQAALAAWAESRGWHYTAADVSTLEDRFPAFGVFRQGSNRYGYNVMRGPTEQGHGWAFDYHYETYSTDSKGNRQTHHHHFSALLLETGMRLSPLKLRSEGFFDKVKGAFGFDDIDFESAEFSRSFWVTAPDKRWAYDVLHQETMEYLLEAPRFALEFEDGPQAIAYRGRTFKPVEFEQALAYLHAVVGRIPRDIRRERSLEA